MLSDDGASRYMSKPIKSIPFAKEAVKHRVAYRYSEGGGPCVANGSNNQRSDVRRGGKHVLLPFVLASIAPQHAQM